MHALILDDEPAIGRVICRIARSAGFTAQAVADPIAFQLYYGRERPDIILLDLQLGGEDGVTQLRFLAEQAYPHAVVLMSGYDQRVLSSAQRLGRDFGLEILTTVTKPFGAEQLAAVFVRMAARLAKTEAASPPDRG